MDPALEFEAQEIERSRAINEKIAYGDSPVQLFYSGAVVFITGATGFLGKQLVEKLLRSCDIKRVYILLRPKKKKTIKDRLNDLVNDPVYTVLKNLKPNFSDKIFPIGGDVSEVGLGISEEDKTKIINEVTIIFHGAATINFNEPLKTSTFINIRGPVELMKLAKQCKYLKSYVHISTAYCHATYPRVGGEVLEKFYPSPVSPTAIIEMAEQFDENKLNKITPKFITNWANTYSFTKAIGEEAVRTLAGNLPVCIVRPAIVLCALREPMPGWIDTSCAYGPTGLVLGGGLGVLRVLNAKKKIDLDLVPVDIVNNAVVTAAYETAERRARNDNDVKIYTVTGTRNPVQYGKMMDVISDTKLTHPTDKSIMFIFTISTANRFLYSILAWILHYLPGYLTDGILRILGKKPMLMRVYKKVTTLNSVLSYFMSNEWHFGDDNHKKLYWSLSPADRLIFDCNMANIDWDHYIRLWCISTRKYIIKDGLTSTKYAIKKQLVLKYVTLLISPLYLYTLYKIAYFGLYFAYCIVVLIYKFFGL